MHMKKIIFLLIVIPGFLAFAQETNRSKKGEVLYNGIVLPETWPPEDQDPASRKPMEVPYLDNPPEMIPIDIGRQLFVDNFLIETTNLHRTFHHAKKYEGNPILVPETALEMHKGFRPAVAPHSGGAWFDYTDRLFKMWYMTGWYGGAALAYSADGIHWVRPDLGILPGTNHIPDPSPGLRWGMDNVRIDWFTDDPSQLYKSLHFYHATDKGQGGRIHVSSDGYHWSKPLASTGPSGDRNTFFYNPFREKWVFSIKTQAKDPGESRARNYWEHDDFVKGAQWRPDDPVFWMGADDLDIPDPMVMDPPQIYDLDVNPYESLLVGIFQVHKGPHNSIANERRIPKMTELNLGFTRDGFHWHRPQRKPFIPATREPGSWERAYLHATGGVMLVVGDRLYFYYSGMSGDAPNGSDMYAGGSTGLAFLRRDGFASMDAGPVGGTLTTRKITFSGSYLFVNVDCPRGELKAEILDPGGKVIPPFSLENSIPVGIDSTKLRLRWLDEGSLASLRGKEVRIRFHLTDGELYSFWVSPHVEGHSSGYVAAGGPEFKGPVDSSSGY